MYFCVKQDLGRLMLDTSLIVNTVNCMKVLHDPLRAGKVRDQNEKPHQHLLRTQVCGSVTPGRQLLSFLLQNQQEKLNWREEILLTVLPVLYHVATWVAHTPLVCSVRIRHMEKGYWCGERTARPSTSGSLHWCLDTVPSLHTGCRGPWSNHRLVGSEL